MKNNNRPLPSLDPRCGTYAGFVRHSKLKEQKCEPCRKAGRIYRNSKVILRSLPPVIRLKCGTTAGYKAHEKNGEFTCDPCRLAINEAVRQRNQKIKEKRAQKNREYRAKNLDHVRAVEKAWREKNPDKRRARDMKRLAWKKGAPVVESFTVEEVLNLYGTDCHICGKPIDITLPRHAKDNKWGLHLDHVIPLAKGGNHTLENIRPAHGFCNLSKGTKTHPRGCGQI